MKNCIVVGRVIPERAAARFGPAILHFKVGDVSGSATIFAQFSQVSVHLNFESDCDNPYLITAIAKSVTAPISNYIAFAIAAAYQLQFDMIIDIERQSHIPISVSEPFFALETDSANTFKLHEEHKNLLIPPTAISNPAAARALEELANALLRPHLSPMYCRLAVESVRESFCPGNEPRGWKELRKALNVRRETLDTFWTLAANQRHGRNVDFNWEKRKECLRIAWEITNRFILYHGDTAMKFDVL